MLDWILHAHAYFINWISEHLAERFNSFNHLIKSSLRLCIESGESTMLITNFFLNIFCPFPSLSFRKFSTEKFPLWCSSGIHNHMKFCWFQIMLMLAENRQITFHHLHVRFVVGLKHLEVFTRPRHCIDKNWFETVCFFIYSMSQISIFGVRTTNVSYHLTMKRVRSLSISISLSRTHLKCSIIFSILVYF